MTSSTGELVRDGVRIHLQAQPAKLLGLLLEAPSQVVTRESLRAALWSDGTSVDFDRSLNFAIAQVRTALGDSAESPRFIRTVSKRGYQFIAPVSGPSRFRVRWRWISAAAAIVVGLGALAAAALWQSRAKEIRIAVARFDNQTGNAALDRLADNLTDSVVADLTASGGHFGVIGNATILRRSRGFRDLDQIWATLHAQYVILGQVQPDGERVRVLAHLIRLPEQTHVKVSRLDAASSESQIAQRIVADFTLRLDSHLHATN